MAVVGFSLGDLFYETFGYRSQVFNPRVPAVKGVRENYRKENGAHGSPYYAKDVANREYYLPVELMVGNDNAEALGVTNASGAYTGSVFLPYPVMTVSSRMRVIKTPLTEREGDALELINMSGWEFNIKGFIINKGANEFAEDDYAVLMRLYKMRKVCRINNVITDHCFLTGGGSGEKQVFIEDFQLLDGRGHKRVRGYEMKLCSNEPFNLVELPG